MFKITVLVVVAIISTFLLVISIKKINICYKEKKISSLGRIGLIYIAIIIPILGYILALQLTKKEANS